jgi:hypothetical protein
MIGPLLFGALVWGSIAAVLVAFGSLCWLLADAFARRRTA